MIRYLITLDRDNDGSFGREISADVLDMRWRLGMGAPYDSMAADSWARITVRNAGGAFSPERQPLLSGTRARIQSRAGAVTRTHFSGVISRIEPDAGDYSQKHALIFLADILPWLADSPARIAPQVEVTADRVIEALLDQATIRRPIVAGYCLIDVAGSSEIDSVRIFPPQNHPRRLAQGKTRFAYVGDWWGASTSARRAISETVASERGRFYLDRQGEAVFLNRHHTLIQEQVAARFSDDMSGMEYSYGDQRLNRVSLRMSSREVGAQGSLLWQLQAPQVIDQHSELLLNLRLLDEREQPIGILAFDRLDARFVVEADGVGTEIRNGVAAEVTQLGTTTLSVRLSNQTRRPAILTRLDVYGQPLYRREALEIVVADGKGMHHYGLKHFSLDAPALSDIATARAFAAYELARRKHPRGTISALRLDARRHEAAALGLSLFDRIRVSETQTGHGSRDYFIVAEAHHVSAGGSSHEATWTLEPADSARFVIVDDSAINNSAEVLAPY